MKEIYGDGEGMKGKEKKMEGKGDGMKGMEREDGQRNGGGGRGGE